MPILPVHPLGMLAGSAAATGGTIVGRSAHFAGLLRGAMKARTSSAKAGSGLRLPGGPRLDVDELRASSDKELKAIQAELLNLLSQKGVNTAGNVTLQLDSGGAVHVLQPAAQQPAIETLLASHPELESRL